MSDLYAWGIKKGAGEKELEEVIKSVFLLAADDLSWLSPNDLVLLKPALNSPDPYPATTHPLAVKAVADLLIEKGAKVVIGDQSGVEHVLQGPEGVIRGSSLENFKKSGMLADPNCQAVGFEQGDWQNDFYQFQSAKAKSWPSGFYLTKWVEKADHIINLPRLSTHGQAGVTLGFKNMVGVLRQDSRMHFHSQGPFYSFFKKSARKAKLGEYNDQQKDFFQKITEISLAVQEKLRLTLFVATRAQLTMGPDAYLLSLGKKRILKSSVAEPETGLVFASQNQLASEVFAIAFLSYLYKNLPSTKKLLQKLIIKLNGQAKELGKESPWQNPFVKHALKIGLAGRDFKVNYKNISQDLKKYFDQILDK